MNLESTMTLEVMIVIALVVAAVGTATANLFRKTGSPYLLTIHGTRSEIIYSGAMLWFLAIAIGVGALVAATALISGVVGLAIFFAIEAVALDICANRTRYVHTPRPVLQHARMRSVHRS